MIIIPGHYQTKSSIGSEKPEIIRIIGADKSKSDNWLTSDNKSIPSYIIEEDYIQLNTSPTKETPKKISNIFSDFETINIDNIANTTATHTPVTNKSQDNDLQKVQNISNLVPEAQKPEIIQKSELTIIMDKINIDNLNKKTNSNIEKPTIELQIPITFDYQINKLLATIDLMELNIDEVIWYIVNSKVIDIKPLLFTAIKTLLTKENNSEINNEENIEIKNTKLIIDEKISEKDEVEKFLKETDKYITENILKNDKVKL